MTKHFVFISFLATITTRKLLELMMNHLACYDYIVQILIIHKILTCYSVPMFLFLTEMRKQPFFISNFKHKLTNCFNKKLELYHHHIQNNVKIRKSTKKVLLPNFT